MRQSINLCNYVKRAALILLSCCLLLPVFSVSAAAESSSQMPSGIPRDEVKGLIDKYWKENEKNAAGMAVSVFDKNGIICSDFYGYADKKKNIPLQETNVLEWGSVSKTLIWVSVMQLYEKNIIALDDDIRNYLPKDFLHNLRFEKPVTMLDLMNHTAGFEEMLLPMETLDKTQIPSLEEALKEHQPAQVFEPGTINSYSNWCAALAAYIIEYVTDQPYYEYVKENIFDVLGMENTALKADLSDNTPVAEKRLELDTYLPDGSSTDHMMQYIIIYPAGMCTSTLEDFTIYAMALADPETKLFKNKDTYAKMVSPSYYLGSSDIAVNCHGFWTCTFADGVIGHSGNTAGCTSQLQFDTKTGAGIVVMTNQAGEHTFTSEMTEEIMGKPTGSRHEGINGKIMSPRTILSGPLKFTSFFNIGEVTEDMFNDIISVHEKNDSVDKIALAQCDYIVISGSEYLSMIIPVILWIAAVFFCFAALWTKLIRFIIRNRKNKENNIPLGKTTAAGSIMVILPLVLMIPAMLAISGSDSWGYTDYTVWSFFYFIIAGLLAALIVWTIILMLKNKTTIKRMVYNTAVILCEGIVIYNIIYWQLYMFWTI